MTLIDEAVLAVQGMIALLLGRREVSDYFDLGLRGLAGSFVAYLIALLVRAYLPLVLGWSNSGAWESVLIVLVLFVTQTGMTALVLYQFGRLDGLVPYLVVDNWATFYMTVLLIGMAMAGMTSEFSLVVMALIVIVIEVNIARLIVTLRPLQIVAFIIAQIIGFLVGMAIIGAFTPVPTDTPF